MRVSFFFFIQSTSQTLSPRLGLGCLKQDKYLTGEHSTLRRHAAALHAVRFFPHVVSTYLLALQNRYRKWCKANNFESMLPEDTRQRKDAASGSGEQTQQSALSDHFNANGTKAIPYSDKVFEAAAIEWLVQTNQVCVT
jgi:hypothetical protein